MKTPLNSIVLMIALTGMGFCLSGCDREVSHTEKTSVKDDGTVKKKETTVTQAPDGTVTKQESESKAKPGSPPPAP